MINNDYSRSAYPLQKRTESCPLTHNFYFCTVSGGIEGQASTMDVCVWQGWWMRDYSFKKIISCLFEIINHTTVMLEINYTHSLLPLSTEWITKWLAMYDSWAEYSTMSIFEANHIPKLFFVKAHVSYLIIHTTHELKSMVKFVETKAVDKLDIFSRPQKWILSWLLLMEHGRVRVRSPHSIDSFMLP